MKTKRLKVQHVQIDETYLAHCTNIAGIIQAALGAQQEFGGPALEERVEEAVDLYLRLTGATVEWTDEAKEGR